MGEALQTNLNDAKNTSINRQLTFLSFLCSLKQLLNDFSSKFHTILQTTHSPHLALFIHSLLADESEMSNSIQTAKQIQKMKFQRQGEIKERIYCVSLIPLVNPEESGQSCLWMMVERGILMAECHPPAWAHS